MDREQRLINWCLLLLLVNFLQQLLFGYQLSNMQLLTIDKARVLIQQETGQPLDDLRNRLDGKIKNIENRLDAIEKKIEYLEDEK